jgi:4-hydroxy-tetrahydrodipicolinate synthase
MSRLSGVIPPVATPLTPEGEVDVRSLEKLVAYLLQNGVTGLFALGTTSETPFLTDAQREVVLDTIVGANAGQVPVVAGVIDATTPRMIAQSRAAVARGVDGIVATACFYARVEHPVELRRHFRVLKEAVELPVLAYDLPVCVHVKLPPDALAELAHDGVIQGLKDSSGDLGSLRRVILATRDLPDFAIFTGSEVIVDSTLSMGGHGVVPGLGNVDPAGYVRLVRLAEAGDWNGARHEQERLCRLYEIVRAADPAQRGFFSSAFGSFKAALQLLGVIEHRTLALPQSALDDVEVERVRALLGEAGLL